jgi:hypothetical protein
MGEGRVMVFNATFNNISATMYILAVSFLVEEAGENYRPVTSLTNFIT